MLQFWKKTGHTKNRSSNCIPVNNSSNESHDSEQQRQTIKHGESSNKVLPLANVDDEELSDIECSSPKQTSRLSKNLHDVLNDKNALPHFIQFLESRNSAAYILCWSDIDAFKADVAVEDAKQPPNNFSPVTSKVDHDSLSVSTDCDSITADSNSLCDYSTATLSEAGVCDNSDSCNSVKVKSNEGSVQHALAIFKKYVALEASYNICCSEEMRKEVMENVCDTQKVLSGSCFNSVQSYVYNIMETEYFNAFLASDFFCKYQIEVLTSGNVVLDDVLYNETALFYFMEFLEQEDQRALLEFWISATNLQHQLQDQKEFFDPIEAQNDAVVLYDKYISLQAHCPLGFSDKVRLAVEQSICGENGLVLDCFQLPLKIVERVIEKNYLKPFLQSQLFYKYLSELINTVQSFGYGSTIDKYSPSDCSSEKSFSTSTFLALEVPQTKRKEKQTDMSIDTRELYDPDALWRRKKSHRLSLGRVTELGRYVTDFEPEPDRKEFKLKDVMKKIVSFEEEEKRREEMAWQVAEMIVKDITSVTLNDEKS